MMQVVEVGDERQFMKCAESFIYRMQDSLRKKPNMESEALLQTCEKLEDFIFRRAIKMCSPVPQDLVWMKYEAIVNYQNSCQRILRTIETCDCDWKKVFYDGRTNIPVFYDSLMTANLKYSSKRSIERASQEKTKVSKSSSSKPLKSKQASSSSSATANTSSVIPSSSSSKPIKKKSNIKLESTITTTQSSSQPIITVTKAGGSHTSLDAIGLDLVTSYDDMNFFEDGQEIDGERGGEDKNDILNISTMTSSSSHIPHPSTTTTTTTSDYNKIKIKEEIWSQTLSQDTGNEDLYSQKSYNNTIVASSQEWELARKENDKLKQMEQERLHSMRVYQQQENDRNRVSTTTTAAGSNNSNILINDNRHSTSHQIASEADREKARKELEEQKRTIYLDDAEDRDELEEFMNL